MESFTAHDTGLDIKAILELAIKEDATDIHLVVNRPPIFRVNGSLISSDMKKISADLLKKILFGILSEKQRNFFEKHQEVDFSYSCVPEYYFRFNIYVEKSNLAASIRVMPNELKDAKELLLPPILRELALRKNGLVLLTGPAGSGKTTTMTYMIDLINRERSCKIITIEDPIEYVHRSKKSLIVQREVGSDTQSFANGLKYALRQDPDVVMIGEIRDLESISMALTAAETGHLVLTTLHSADAIESINRIIDVYPSGKQNQIRVQLAEVLNAVVGQQLVPLKSGHGRALVTEVMTTNLAIRNLIRRGALTEIRGQMRAGGQHGMYNLEQCLSYLYSKDIISKDTAKEYARYSDLLEFNA